MWHITQPPCLLAKSGICCGARRHRILPVGTTYRAILQLWPEVTIEGTDGLVRPRLHIPAGLFDGTTLPFTSSNFEIVTFVNVLHPTLIRRVLLLEDMRGGKRMPAEDHLRKELLTPRLHFMDWVGNVQLRVALESKYCSEAQRPAKFDELGWKTSEMTASVKLYRTPTS